MNYTLQELGLLSHVKRWQNVPTVQSESVAEHTCQVALIVLWLRQWAKFDVGKALTIAVLHDLPEVDLTDIPHNVSKAFPAIAKAKHDSELLVVSSRLPEYAALFNEVSFEAKIVKLADTLQVCQFAQSQLALAKSDRMAIVLQEAKAIALDLATELYLNEVLEELLHDYD